MTGNSHDVAALIERARSPIGADRALWDAVSAAIKDPRVSDTDRGQLMAARLGISQGLLSGSDMRILVAETAAFLRSIGDVSSLVSVLALSAAVAAVADDLDACLEASLDAQALLRDAPEGMLTYRTANSLGVAFLALGAYDLASQHFDEALDSAGDQPLRVQVALASNLVLAISRSQLLEPDSPRTMIERARIERAERVLAPALDSGAEDRVPEFARVGLAHAALVCGDTAAAADRWGDFDALNIIEGEGFVRYFAIVEAPIAFARGDLDRARVLAERCLEPLTDHDMVPLRRYEALRLRSRIDEAAGHPEAALASARQAADTLMRDLAALPDALMRLVSERAELEHHQRHLLVRTSELSEQVMIDELTRVGNRRAFDAHIDAVRSAAPRPVAVLAIDLDRFKEINDGHGHSTGDRVVARAAAIITNACRNTDPIFRYGGDEFFVVADTGSLDHARILAERIRSGFLNEPWTLEGLDDALTCSVGVAVGVSDEIDDLVRAADTQLLQAKQAGRNLVRPADQRSASQSAIA